jgi:hypothetical protein
MEQEIGIVLFSEGLDTDSTADSLLAGLFTALNIRLKEAIQSNSGLERISLGDKVIHISPGKHVTSLFFTSETTLMTSHISKHLTKRFEEMFDIDLIYQAQNGKISGEFSSFNNQLDAIKKLLIL